MSQLERDQEVFQGLVVQRPFLVDLSESIAGDWRILYRMGSTKCIQHPTGSTLILPRSLPLSKTASISVESYLECALERIVLPVLIVPTGEPCSSLLL